MNKNEFITSMSGSAGISKTEASNAVDAVLDAISNTLIAGGELRLIGFGTFGVANRVASIGRNPRTGEAIQIAAAKRPKFKAGKGLKDAVNK